MNNDEDINTVNTVNCLQEYTNTETNLREYHNSLHNNWRRWFILQTKQTMLAGKKTIFVSVLYNKYYKKGKTLLNFWKPLPDDKYYDKNTNVYVTHQKTRELIDYIESIGLKWFVGIYWDVSTVFSVRYFTIHASWSHFDKKTQNVPA
jgi:hypothetical protein